jgi:hypothetical protein
VFSILQQLGQGFDLGQIMITPDRDTVVNVVVDQRPLRFGHGAFDSVKLSSKIKARPPFVDHANDAAQMPLGAFQPGCDGRVACMDMKF